MKLEDTVPEFPFDRQEVFMDLEARIREMYAATFDSPAGLDNFLAQARAAFDVTTLADRNLPADNTRAGPKTILEPSAGFMLATAHSSYLETS